MRTEPTMECPNCGTICTTEWVDIGFGPYSQQAGPYTCLKCHWVESGCPQEVCGGDKCTSYSYCQGYSLRITNRLESLVFSLIIMLNIEEESDSGQVFKPNRIQSCRAMDGLQINTILSNIEKEIKFKE